MKKYEFIKLRLEDNAEHALLGEVFGTNEAEFLGFTFDREPEGGEYNYYLDKSYDGYNVYARFDREPEGLTEAEECYLLDALRGERFYYLMKYEAVNVNDMYIPIDIVDSVGGFYIVDEHDLLNALEYLTDDVSVVNLVIDYDDIHADDIKGYAEHLGIKGTLKSVEVKAFK